MNTYKRLFNINLFHQFYSNDNTCYDLVIEPTPVCKALINRHRLVLKETANGIDIFAPADGNNNLFIPLTDSAVFSFHLIKDNPDFSSFTTLSNISPGTLHLFSNQGINSVGVADLIIGEIPVAQAGKNNLADVLGMIKIHHNASIPTTLTAYSEFKITFSAKQETWKYYVVIGNNNNNVWSVVDTNTNPVQFIQTDLNQNDLPNDQVAQAIKNRYPAYQRYLFESNQSVSYCWEGIKKLQLKKDVNILIDHLPNPSFYDQGIKIIRIM